MESNYSFNVTELEAPRTPYGDHHENFLIKDVSKKEIAEYRVKEFCTKFLRPAIPKEEREEKKKTDFAMNFCRYYTVFRKLGERQYEYFVIKPSTH
ncbi:MAG: hypothetical protein PF445_12470 [Melioribacteraceae bacterium]|jgi:hypothetical protein|nr:hypothetical protein [Melioribacteraceae bacterium]